MAVGNDLSPGGDDQKSYQEILGSEIETAIEALHRPGKGLFFSGLSAGLDIGFSLLMMAVLRTAFAGEVSAGVLRVLLANAYALGFIFVVLGQSELFTEHTTRAMLPVLAGKASWRELARLWGLVYVSNVAGAAAFAAITVLVMPALGVVDPAALERIAVDLTEHSSPVILASAMLAGWMMGLLSWLVKAGQDTISKIFVVWMVTASIGLAGFHHCIVGTVEVLGGVFSGGAVTLSEFGRFLTWATLGNAIGGVVFVAIVKYAHARREAAG